MAKRNAFVSGIGSARYAWVHPDRPDTAFNADGEYKLQIILEPKAAERIKAAVMDVVMTEFKGEDIDKLSIPIDTEEDTGNVIVKMKSKFPPKFIDSVGTPIVGDNIPHVWGGSTVQAYGNIKAYEVNKNQRGISLQLNTVQIINLIDGGTPDGFEAVEGGYTAANDNPMPAHIVPELESGKAGDEINDAINF